MTWPTQVRIFPAANTGQVILHELEHDPTCLASRSHAGAEGLKPEEV
jgi:hypothetical protein